MSDSQSDAMIAVALGTLWWPGAIVAILATAFVRTVRPDAEVNIEESRVRSGRRSALCTEITSAELRVSGSGSTRSLTLLMHAPGLRLGVDLISGSSITVDAVTRDQLIEILAASSIEFPRDPFDPTGRFARSGFPQHITRDQAIALVRQPPAPGAPLPTDH